MGSLKPKSKFWVVDYRLSIHYGICHGPVDALTMMFSKDREIYPSGKKLGGIDEAINHEEVYFDGLLSLYAPKGNLIDQVVAIGQTDLTINLPDLFGGNKKEGGVVGTATFLPGKSDQVMPELLAQKLSLTSATCPGYRGITSVFLHGGNQGFLWCQNNPYLPDFSATVFRISHCNLGPSGPTEPISSLLSVIQVGENPPDSNPAHMILDCLTNKAWGMGGDVSQIDLDSFTYAAQYLYDEDFGLSMTWFKQATIQDFVNEILDHISAYLYINPRTGLMTIKLLRDDYDVDDLIELNPDNSEVINPQRKAWGDTVNEINVTWTNPTNNQEESITFQDLANIAMQGGVVSDSRNYYGIRNKELATVVGARDIRSASAALFTCDVNIDRFAFNITPGFVLKLKSPEDGIETLICRVGKVDYGKPGDLTIKASLMEDIFALEPASYTAPPSTAWVEPGSNPEQMAYSEFITTPLPILIRNGIEAASFDDEYPRVSPMVLAQQVGSDSNTFNLWSDVVNSTGSSDRKQIATMLETPRSSTLNSIPFEPYSTLTPLDLGFVDGDYMVSVGDFLIFNAFERQDELVMIDAYDAETQTFTLARGMYDTIPQDWPIETSVWYIPSTFSAFDKSEIVDGQSVLYQLQSRTSRGVLPINDLDEMEYLANDRPYRPFRPANVVIDGDGGNQRLVYDVLLAPVPTTIDVTWSTRNRFTEDQVAVRWDAGNVTPELGQVAVVRVKSGSGIILIDSGNLTTTSFQIDTSLIELEGIVYVSVTSKVNGLESYQNIVREIHVVQNGFGNNYGENYGQ